MKKSQAAMEFLVTYGWAILASMIAIAALAYFGLNPKTTLPDKCLFSNNIGCPDYLITQSSSTVKLKLVNGLGQTIYNAGGSADASTIHGSCSFDGTLDPAWPPDEIREMTCDLTGAQFVVKDKTKVTFTLNYQKTPTGYVQTAVGELYAAPQ
jgi:hypothetical protein